MCRVFVALLCVCGSAMDARQDNSMSLSMEARLQELNSRREAIIDELAAIEKHLNHSVYTDHLKNFSGQFGASDSRRTGWKPCTGYDAPRSGVCYRGRGGVPYVGHETVSVYVKRFDKAEMKGVVSMRGWGKTHIKCLDKHVSIVMQKIYGDFGACAPPGIVLNDVRFCSDQNMIKVTVFIESANFKVHATLKEAPCN
eukprot:TRINITY_DN122607_c0_g1_i1.p1 TRINITY_DN122607_c0_g1~~TRINITY_DN122607_c0_g1_i1.p1  ORF type:complete len:198 (+),score=19.13 TRINITY_DN122607_c0_g1_i1:65-658(+)